MSSDEYVEADKRRWAERAAATSRPGGRDRDGSLGGTSGDMTARYRRVRTVARHLHPGGFLHACEFHLRLGDRFYVGTPAPTTSTSVRIEAQDTC